MAYMEFKTNQERQDFWLSDDGIELIKQWKREGIANREIAIKYMGVNPTTLNKWSKKSDALAQAIYMTNDVVNSKVESALLKRALGYDVNEETWELIEGELRRTKVSQKHIPPDVKACLSWLFNRRPDRWRATQEPLESTQYVSTVKDILVAMKEVATTGEAIEVKVEETEE